jgi:hypothetical protein
VGKLEGGMTILNWILNKFFEGEWTKLFWLRSGTSGSPAFDSVMNLEMHQ